MQNTDPSDMHHYVLVSGTVKRMKISTGQGRGFLYEINDGGIHNELHIPSGIQETVIEYVEHGVDKSITMKEKVTRVTIPVGDDRAAVFETGDGRIIRHTMEESTIKKTKIQCAQ